MAVPNNLKMTCNRCKVSNNCSSNGQSPLIVNGKNVAICELIGGYGRTPVEENILSQESLSKSRADGNCLTLAHVPSFDEESNEIIYKLVKIFHSPNFHPREKTDFWQDSVIPKNHK